MNKSPTGPMSSEEFRSLVDAPFGAAVAAIRKYDPLYGKLSSDGEPIKWKVKLIQEVRMVGYVTVEAATEEEAEMIAGEIPDEKVGWDYNDHDNSYPIEVTPA